MKIAVASGKGGTGKTSVAINLALSLSNAQIIDCDVEEPNVHIFLNPEITQTKPVELQVPVIDEEKCDFCGACSRFCQFNALFVAGETSLVFPELCHSCGGCKLVCPQQAISEQPRKIGEIHKGHSNGIDLIYGELKIGEPLAVPVIAAVKEEMKSNGPVILDSSPGSACPVVETVHGADFCIMVTEPTPFGLHDLEVATEVVRQLDVPLGVVVNFAGIGDRGVYEFCEKTGIPILMEIPYDRKIAELYSRGIPFSLEMDEWKTRFRELYRIIKETVQ